MLTRRCRRALCGALAVAAAVPGTAWAATHVFHEGIIWANETVYSPWASIYEVSARSLDGNTVCVAAFEGNGYQQVGQVACSNDLASHAYNGSWRRGGARGVQGLGVRARARIDYY